MKYLVALIPIGLSLGLLWLFVKTGFWIHENYETKQPNDTTADES